MSSDRWSPLRDVMSLREAMDRLIEDSFVRPPAERGGRFPVDVIEQHDQFVVRAALPGVAPDALQVTVQGEALTIKGRTGDGAPKDGERYLMHEMQPGILQRTLALPAPVAADRAEAQLEHGVLILTLPKLQSSAPRQIRIGKAGGAAPGAAAEAAHTRAQASGDKAPASNNPSVTDPTQLQGKAAQRGTEMAADKPQRDPVTVESEESFPASDPPSWTPERA